MFEQSARYCWYDDDRLSDITYVTGKSEWYDWHCWLVWRYAISSKEIWPSEDMTIQNISYEWY